MSNDWIEHNGGPQPVADNVWVETSQRHGLGEDSALAGALDWRHIERSRDIVRYRILNQHLIDEARLEGIRLGLEAAHKAVCALPVTPDSDPERVQDDCADSIAYDLMINIDTIAREAVLDQLTCEAQAQGMGYDND